MRVKVLKNFIDKETKEYHKVGTQRKPTIIDVSEERAKEILTAGNYIEVVENEPDAENDAEQEEGTVKTHSEILDDVLEGMTVAELKEHAEKYEVDLNGARTKADISEAIKGPGMVEPDSENSAEPVETEQDKEIEEMTLEELKQYASEHDIRLSGARTKAAIIDAIKAVEE